MLPQECFFAGFLRTAATLTIPETLEEHYHNTKKTRGPRPPPNNKLVYCITYSTPKSRF